MRYDVKISGTTHPVEIEIAEGGTIRAQISGHHAAADVASIAPGEYSILLDGRSYEVHVTDDGASPGLLVRCNRTEYRAQVTDPRSWRGIRHDVLEAEGPQRLLAPMPGKVVRVLTAAGAQVTAGQGLVVVEAMKMQNEIRAPKSGVIERVLVHEGQTVRSQEALLIIA